MSKPEASKRAAKMLRYLRGDGGNGVSCAMRQSGAREPGVITRRMALLAAGSVLLVWAALGVSVARAAGAPLFVAPGGSDVGNCQTQTQPCKTIG